MRQVLIILVFATIFFPQSRLLLPLILRPPLMDLCLRINDMEILSQWRVLQQVQCEKNPYLQPGKHNFLAPKTTN